MSGLSQIMSGCGLSQNYECIVIKLWVEYHKIMSGLSQNHEWIITDHEWIITKL
jgi:hypothetical protein